MTSTHVTTTNRAPSPVGAYPHSRRVGPLLFLSGIGPREPGTNAIPGLVLGKEGEIVEYDFRRQCLSVFANVRSVIEASGAELKDLVDVTVFLTDMRRDFSEFNALYAEHLGFTQACRTTVEVQRLPTPIAIELKCILWVGERGGST